MKILLMCANGLSTGILMNKMNQWAEQNNEDLEVKAIPIDDYLSVYKDYDVLLVGPQMRYKIKDVQKAVTDRPSAVINPSDYALGNVENIIKEVKRMIAESYDIITDSPTKRIYEAVKMIPKGRVATYGQVAEMAGDRKMARAVGNALHKNPEPGVIPCHRVVNSKGELAGAFAFGGAGVQAGLLESEGVRVVDGVVNLKKYGFIN